MKEWTRNRHDHVVLDYIGSTIGIYPSLPYLAEVGMGLGFKLAGLQGLGFIGLGL